MTPDKLIDTSIANPDMVLDTSIGNPNTVLDTSIANPDMALDTSIVNPNTVLDTSIANLDMVEKCIELDHSVYYLRKTQKNAVFGNFSLWCLCLNYHSAKLI